MIQRHRLEEADYRGERFAEGFDSLQPGGPREGHDLKGNKDLLTLTRPDVIAQVHADYLDAGADLVETKTFNATALRQARKSTRLNYSHSSASRIPTSA